MAFRSSSMKRLRSRSSATFVAGALVAAAVVLTPLGSAAAPVNGCFSKDNGDPNLVTFNRSPGSVDVRSGSKNVSLTARVNDTGGPGSASGVSSVSVSLASPTFQHFLSATLTKNGANYTGQVRVPKWTEPGNWQISNVFLADKASNYAFLDHQDLIDAGLPANLTVQSNEDNTRPKLGAFGFKPGSVNTRLKTKKIVFTAKINDSQSGGSSAFVNASSHGHFTFAFLTHKSGNTFRGTMIVPRWVGTSTWKIDNVSVNDKIGNNTDYTYAQLGTKHFKRSFKVVSGKDTGKPSISSFARTPGSVDVRKRNGTVSATVHARDGGSGVSGVFVGFTSKHHFGASAFMHRTSGSAKNGVWKGSAKVFKCFSEAGTWKASVTVIDAAGNSRTYNAADLSRMHDPNKIAVKAGDHGVPNATTPSSIAPNGDVVVKFNEAVNGINTDSATLRPAFTSPNPPVAGAWTCETGGGAPANCLNGKVKKATFNPSANLSSFTSYQLELNPEHFLSITDLAGNPFDRFSAFISTSA